MLLAAMVGDPPRPGGVAGWFQEQVGEVAHSPAGDVHCPPAEEREPMSSPASAAIADGSGGGSVML